MPSPMLTARRMSLIATFALVSLAPATMARAQATGTIEGVVTTTAGARPLSDVQITVVGTTLGARTDDRGRYRIVEVPAGTQAVRSQRIGLASVTHAVAVVASQTASVDFSLAEAALSLDAVVVTGTAAESRKKEVGNAMATIDMKPIEVEPLKNTQDILAGRGPGITVMQNSGQPGAGGTIRLRGTNSITQSNAPIVYVDGVRIYSDAGPLTPSARQSTLAMNDIKADDIERIEIVKGAAATTLYGTQASGGVIQIFTKKGSAGSPEWNLDAGTGLNFMGHVGPSSDPTGLFLNQCTGANLHDAFGNAFVDPTCPASGSWLQHGNVQRYSLGVRGGSGALTYYLSGNYDDNPGVVQTSDAKSGGFRANFGFTPAKNLIFSVNSSYQKQLIHWLPDGNLANGFTLNVMRGPFGNFKGGPQCVGITIPCVSNVNVLDQDIENNGDHFISGFSLQYSPVTAFTNRFNIGFDYNNSDNKSVLPFGFLNLPTGSINSQAWNHTKLSLDYAGSFLHSVRTPRLMSTFSWGGQIFDDRERYTGIMGTGFAGPGEPTLASAASISLGVDSRPRVVNAGYFLQEMLGWKDRLFVTGGLRVDGNSAFGQNFGLETYPKISASYVISEEGFWPTRLIPTMKLRAALGESGKAPGAFDAVRTWDPVSGDAGKPGVTVAQLGDPNLGPERTREMEYGFDMATPGDRVAVEMTYYRARTYGTLIGVTLPPSNGFSRTQLENAGTIQNSGLEAQISPVFLRTSSVDWRGRFSASWMRSEAVDIGGQIISTGLGSYVRTGMPVPSLFGAKITNPDAVGVPPIVVPDQYIGPVYPTRLLSAGMTITLHHDITLDALADYQGGAYLTNFIGYQNALRNVWQPCYAAQQALKAGNTASLTALDQGRCAIDRTIANSDFWASKTDFVKLRSISVAYDLPQRFTHGVHNATLILAGQNLWKWTKFDGADPEANDATDAGAGLGRREYYQIPPFKTVMLSIRTSF